ncbi:unnamed protein product [Euphydryas editha]|uniref:Uncharacterized protein n=1 Tax=Euphydryas editha TaxID=104508 RepID=A0AAU9U9N0_EUPED|nr:unnamed protein product [Euphydryas editha]
MKRADESPRISAKGTSLKASTIHKQRRLLTTPTSVFMSFFALTTGCMHSRLTKALRHQEIFAILNAQINTTSKHCKRTALTSPILASLYAKADLKEQTALWSLLCSSAE